MKSNLAIKILGISFVSLLIIGVIKAVYFSTSYGISVSYRIPGYMKTGNEHGYLYSNGYNNLPSTIIQILLIITIISIFIGIILVALKYLFSSEDLYKIKGTFTGKKVKNPCGNCGNELNPEWNLCPHCGKGVRLDKR